MSGVYVLPVYTVFFFRRKSQDESRATAKRRRQADTPSGDAKHRRQAIVRRIAAVVRTKKKN
jgi:hypothetical protein